MQSNEVLVVTATINVGRTPFVEIKSDQERLFQYLCSLIAWIKLTSIDTIVFCENSNTSYDFGKIIEFAKNEGKNLEVLVFNGNQKSQQHGKGYGEGRIIKYALSKSKKLNDNVNFYKITGRLFVLNFEMIRQVYTEFPNVFKIPAWVVTNEFNNINNDSVIEGLKSRIRAIKTRGLIRGLRSYPNPNNNVYTVFYKANVKFFKNNLLNSYKRIHDNWGYCMECAYYDDLLKRERDFSLLLMECQIVGRSGSNGNLLTGLDYTDDIKNLAKTFM
jgi:hypothetical protein